MHFVLRGTISTVSAPVPYVPVTVRIRKSSSGVGTSTLGLLAGGTHCGELPSPAGLARHRVIPLFLPFFVVGEGEVQYLF